MSRVIKAFAWLLLSLGLFITLLCLGGVFLLTTEAGSVKLVNLLNESIPGLQLSGTSGRLYKNIHVESLNYSNPTVSISFEDLTIDWSLENLWKRHVVIEGVTINRVIVSPIDEKESSNEPLKISIPSLPIGITIRQLNIVDVLIKKPQAPIDITDVELVGSWAGEVVMLDHLALNYEGAVIVANASLGEQGASSIKGGVRVSGNFQGKDSALQARFFGPLDELQLALKSEGLIEAEGLGKINIADPTLPFELSVTHQGIEVDNTSPVSITSGSLVSVGSKLGLSAEYKLIGTTPKSEPVSLSLSTKEIGLADSKGQINMPIAADVIWEISHPALTKGLMKGVAELRLFTGALHITQSTQAPYESNLEGKIENLSEEPHIEMSLQLNDIKLPTTENNVFVLKKGAIAYFGTVAAGSASLNLEFHEGQVGDGVVALSGDLKDKHFDIRSGQVKLFHGVADLSGSADWDGVPKFKVTVDGKHFNPQRIIGGEQSDISFVADAAGVMEKSAPLLSLDLKSVAGSWRSHKVTGKGRFNIAEDSLEAKNVSLMLGENSLKANMSLGARVSGEYVINAPNLSAILSELSGSANGAGKITGTKSEPMMVGEMRGSQLAYRQASIAALSSNYRVSATGKRPSELSLDLSDIRLGDDFSGDVSFGASGLAASHSATLTLEGPQVVGEIAIQGGLKADKWLGTMDSLKISTQALSRWSLVDSVSLTVSTQGDFETKQAICLSDEEKLARACLMVARTGKNIKGERAILLDGDIKKLPIALINSWMPRGITAIGDFNAKFNAGIKDGRIAADGNYQILNGMIGSEKLNGETIPIKRFDGTFSTSGDQVNLNVGADIADWFKLDLNGSLPVTENLPLSLNIELAAENVGWLEDFVPEIAGSKGRLVINGTVSGTRSKPRLSAKGKFDNGQLVVPSVGLSVSEINLNVDNDARDRLLFKLIASSKDNQIKLSGDVDPVDKSLPYQLDMEGRNFPLIRLPELELDVSPVVQVTGNIHQLTVTGKLDVPYFAYILTEIPKSATRVSSDQILIISSGEEQLLTEEKMPDWFIDAFALNIDVSLGEKVTAEGLGLFAHLNGSLTLLKELGGDLNGEGTVIISEGHFDAYGQELSVSKGRVRFAGPLSNPSLKIRALRQNIPVTAGMDISGTARAPKFEIFSDPALPAGEALSYVVVGRSLGDGTRSDGALISQAALGFGLEQSSVITNKVRDLFALDELGVQTGDAIDETALVAGKQLTPKVSVRSEMNIFDQLWSFYLRYQLTDKWSVEAESGEQQGADVIYQVEHESLEEFLPFSK